nr:uncharacterized protein LOC118879710 isoform X2 [Drosophila suzukii]
MPRITEIQICFNILNPEKEAILSSKWDTFKEKVFCFYEEQIQNEEQLKLLKTVQKTVSLDCKDYIYTVLLTKERTSERNYHYWDSQESFVRTCRRTNVADHKNL